MLVLGKGTGTHKLARGLLGKPKLTRRHSKKSECFRGHRAEGISNEIRRSRRPAFKMAVNVWLRVFFYGLHGFFDEVFFTSLFNFAESNFKDWSFRGHSSLWSFFMYGFGSFIIEQLYLRWKDKAYLPMPVRGVLYVVWVYVWEFSCGMLLRYFNACPWDYSSRQWNLSGLITLQYFPAWYAASLWQELVAGYLLTLSKDAIDIRCKDC